MVGHDVDQDAETLGAGLHREALKALGAAARGIHARDVDHVVPVVGARRRLEQRHRERAVDAIRRAKVYRTKSGSLHSEWT